MGLDAVAPGRGDALVRRDMVTATFDATGDFVTTTKSSVAKVALASGSLKEAMTACRDVCDPKFSDYAISKHCLPFNVARFYDAARDINTTRIWTA